MRLEVQGKKAVTSPSEKVVLRALRSLRTHGPSSIAILSRDDGSFLQVGGGAVTCVLELRDAGNGKMYRAYKTERSKVFNDGDILSFSGNKIRLASDEWLMMREVEPAFEKFLSGEELPASLNWRELPELSKKLS